MPPTSQGTLTRHPATPSCPAPQGGEWPSSDPSRPSRPEGLARLPCAVQPKSGKVAITSHRGGTTLRERAARTGASQDISKLPDERHGSCSPEAVTDKPARPETGRASLEGRWWVTC